MKAVTIAAAGAAVVTTVSAASHVKHMHAKLHGNVARDTWVDWNATASTSVTPVNGDTAKTTTTTKAPVKAATTTASSSSSFLWEDWTSSSLAVDPAKTSSTTSSTTTVAETWADWSSTSASSTPVEGVKISTTTATVEHTWADWTSASSIPVDPATTTSTEEHTWGDWTTSDPVDPTTTVTETWGDWTTVDQTTTITLASTVTATKYVEPVSAESTDSSTWAEWTSTSASSVAAAVTSVITSTVTPGWSSSGWFGPSVAVEADSCAISVITSYGLPTWYPTPVLAVSTTSSTTSSATWADWTSSSSNTPAAAATTTTSSTSSYVWADWTSSSIPVEGAQTTTSASYVWGDWTSTSTYSPAAVATSSETWADWSSTTETASVSVSTASSSASSGSWSKPSGGSQGGSPGISSNGDSWGMTYSPYTAQGGCKDAGTIAADMAVIAQKGFSSVRVYSTDCSTLENIGGSARNNGLKLILGVWISSTGISGAQGQVHDIVAWAQWDIVELIVVGNEAVFNGYCSASELAGFISSSAAAFKGAGYTGAVTTTEPLSVWEDTSNASAFCSVVDVVGANLYAFFNAQVTADKAGSFIQSEINILDAVCSGKPVYVLESGWPHAGNCNGAACPSPQNQATALKGIQATVGAQVVFLSYEDEPWKEPGQFGVEQFWGCAGVF
ncbi:murein transglycosylase [Cladophialophora psammophila CBS 110553]|uniref:Probable beta-glucosidase btgE n=1 Tax=Cladophialophora psammophila CBS 110553 TaxID=1182543 RepID=W9WP74_9EURO|nr:murein transglycosylase [Cladophialophora psammophila CBS 110553]EXJ69703.1 murein transglycosylase [Cladophialophora psammophila CBS 110553]